MRELTPGYFQITATPRRAVYDPTVQYEFWFTDTQIADTRRWKPMRVISAPRCTGLRPAAVSNPQGLLLLYPGRERSGNRRSWRLKGRPATMRRATSISSKGKITESHGERAAGEGGADGRQRQQAGSVFGRMAGRNGKWNTMWGVKIEQTKDRKHICGWSGQPEHGRHGKKGR